MTEADRLKILEDKVDQTATVLGDLDKFNVIIDATGSKQVLDRVLSDSRIDSTILLMGFPYGELKYNFENLVGLEKVIVGSVGAEREDFANALRLLSKLDMAPFIQTVMPLEDFEKAWRLHKTSKHLKILLKP